MKYGRLDSFVKYVLGRIGEFVIAGDHIETIRQLFDNTTVHDSGIISGKASTFFEIPYLNENRKFVNYEIAIPITDQSREFNELTFNH